MKRFIARISHAAIACACTFAILSLSTAAHAARAADPLASPKTQSVLDYLTNLPNRTDNRVVSGQHTFMTDNLIQAVANATGKYPGLVGVDYYYQNNSSTNNQIIAWSNANNLISICHHWDNPATGGTAWDASYVDFTQLITPGTSLNTKFRSYLDQVAAGLQTLQNGNVVVLYRPFHEMNGNWFWWGAKNATEFKNAWVYVFNYLTQTKGLHNLLWVWAPNASLDTTYYPGSAYVDVVGVDLYGSPYISKVAGYDQLSTLNKPFALTEWGPCDANAGCSSPVDVSQMIAGIKSSMPKTVFWMEWAQTWSLSYNAAGATKLLADPWVVTRDEISLSGVAPSPPQSLTVVAK